VTPRWLVSFLPWTPVESGTYRVNKVKDASEAGIAIECSPSDSDELPATHIDYEDQPREYTLSTVTTTIEVQTRISDLYRSPMDQVREQLGVLIEMVKERQESELVNNANYGLLSHVVPRCGINLGREPDSRRFRRPHRKGLEGASFLPCPSSGYCRIWTRVHLAWRSPSHGDSLWSPFLTWRGLPLVPCDKLRVVTARPMFFYFARAKRSVASLDCFSPVFRRGQSEPDGSSHGNQLRGAAKYLISLYCSAAVLSDDAIGVLENVDVGQYHEYK